MSDDLFLLINDITNDHLDSGHIHNPPPARSVHTIHTLKTLRALESRDRSDSDENMGDEAFGRSF